MPPLWALAVMAFIGLIDPVSHGIIRHFPPEGAAPTGGHTVDTIFYLAGMEHAHPPWTSPYTLCGEPYTEGDISLFAIPFHHLFGAVGTIGDWLHIEPFYMIALANGACAAFYLYAVYCFLVLVVPRLAGRAFLLFSLGGGLGGLLYLLTAPRHSHPDFGVYFQRYFMYELNEGARFQPWLMAARLYYTLPFGLAFLGLAAFWRGLESGRRVDGIVATMLLALPAFINMRLGPMFWMVLVLLACCHPVAPWRRRIAWSGVALIGTSIGLGASAWMISLNPQLVENVARSQRTALWFSPIVSATFFYWLIVPGAILRSGNSAKGIFRYAAWAAIAYVGTFAALYLAYQLYYGNFLRTGEFHVAVKISDWALLLGTPLGLALAWWKGKTPQVATDADAPPWAALWLLLFFTLSISAWGQGWFLKFTPDRFAIMIGVPLAILGAAAIERGVVRWPKIYRSLHAAFIVCGVLSIGVTWLVTYGPLGYRTLQQHYPWTRFAFMNQADADTLAHLEEGVVLAPSDGAPIMGDIAVLKGNSTVYGIGIQDYARHEGPALRGVVAKFFHPDTPDDWRKARAEEWCVRYVYCPDTDPVNPETVAQLRACGWLTEVAGKGNAVMFEMRDSVAP
ncbi:MAG: hypothetical protein JNK74_05860 [Candidatus Hydrogenedentes bacterium]|nr:hypothetical protein [Candidatus Hydrogenedentota bacterium]